VKYRVYIKSQLRVWAKQANAPRGQNKEAIQSAKEAKGIVLTSKEDIKKYFAKDVNYFS
jgi:hypothetical protein